MQGIIVAGVSRAGKTTLTERLHNATGFSMLSGDLLVSALGDAYPQLEIRHGNPHDPLTEKLWPFFHYLMKVHTEWEQRPFIFDATYLAPADIARAGLDKKYPVVFLGYPSLTVEEKLAHIRLYDAPDDWTAERDDAHLSQEIKALIALSKRFEDECATHGIRFFDTGADFKTQSDAAFEYVIKHLK